MSKVGVRSFVETLVARLSWIAAAWAALAKPPQALWTEALAPHSLENVGRSDLHVISVEIKIPLPVGPGPRNA
jgi:hypothetical protein